ncbi:MAG: DUF3943 domain-containing protein [Labilithrix sp.]
MTPAVLIASVSAGEAELAEPVALPPRAPSVVVPVLHSFVLMTLVRGAESYLYPDPFSKPKYFGDHYEEAFTRPPLFDTSKPAFRWDGDPLSINLVGHGLYGSEFYMRARQCRWGGVGSFFFAAATSAVWEYAFEANGTRPSAQDLVYTPLAGVVLGEARYRLYRWTESRVVRAAMDPFGEIERALGSGC